MSEKKKTKKGTKSVTSAPGGPSDPMDLNLLEQMVKLMSQHDLSTVDVRNGDKRVVLKRGAQFVTAPVAAQPSYGASYAAHAPQPAAPAAGSSAGNAQAAPAAADSDAGLVPIKSPMVGTFYARPSPDAKPFVSVGTSVDEDTDVCVIAAMKVFNNIKAETKGTVAKILVENGQTVEFGQVLFLVKP